MNMDPINTITTEINNIMTGMPEITTTTIRTNRNMISSINLEEDWLIRMEEEVV